MRELSTKSATILIIVLFFVGVAVCALLYDLKGSIPFPELPIIAKLVLELSVYLLALFLFSDHKFIFSFMLKGIFVILFFRILLSVGNGLIFYFIFNKEGFVFIKSFTDALLNYTPTFLFQVILAPSLAYPILANSLAQSLEPPPIRGEIIFNEEIEKTTEIAKNKEVPPPPPVELPEEWLKLPEIEIEEKITPDEPEEPIIEGKPSEPISYIKPDDIKEIPIEQISPEIKDVAKEKSLEALLPVLKDFIEEKPIEPKKTEPEPEVSDVISEAIQQKPLDIVEEEPFEGPTKIMSLEKSTSIEAKEAKPDVIKEEELSELVEELPFDIIGEIAPPSTEEPVEVKGEMPDIKDLLGELPSIPEIEKIALKLEKPLTIKEKKEIAKAEPLPIEEIPQLPELKPFTKKPKEPEELPVFGKPEKAPREIKREKEKEILPEPPSAKKLAHNLDDLIAVSVRKIIDHNKSSEGAAVLNKLLRKGSDYRLQIPVRFVIDGLSTGKVTLMVDFIYNQVPIELVNFISAEQRADLSALSLEIPMSDLMSQISPSLFDLLKEEKQEESRWFRAGEKLSEKIVFTEEDSKSEVIEIKSPGIRKEIEDINKK